jgi:DNA-binding transcriptional regulator YiaG
MKEIKEARLKAGLTQQEMSVLLGIPKRTIEEWEAGRMRCPEYTKKMVIKELEKKRITD